jgi:hypothetical protein
MSTKEPLTSCSFEAENETALRAYTEELFEFALECKTKPGEESVRKACGAARHVWDTAEGMMHANIYINPEQLAKSIEGIGLCIEAISQMQLPATTPPNVDEHISQMKTAMIERRDELNVLLKEGKMAFIHRLRAGRVAENEGLDGASR